MYSPESINVPRGRFCVVLWIWATMVAVMLLARATIRDESSPKMAPKVSLRIFRTTLATICRMDLANNPVVWLHRWYGFAEHEEKMRLNIYFSITLTMVVMVTA